MTVFVIHNSNGFGSNIFCGVAADRNIAYDWCEAHGSVPQQELQKEDDKTDFLPFLQNTGGYAIKEVRCFDHVYHG